MLTVEVAGFGTGDLDHSLHHGASAVGLGVGEGEFAGERRGTGFELGRVGAKRLQPFTVAHLGFVLDQVVHRHLFLGAHRAEGAQQPLVVADALAEVAFERDHVLGGPLAGRIHRNRAQHADAVARLPQRVGAAGGALVEDQGHAARDVVAFGIAPDLERPHQEATFRGPKFGRPAMQDEHPEAVVEFGPVLLERLLEAQEPLGLEFVGGRFGVGIPSLPEAADEPVALVVGLQGEKGLALGTADQPLDVFQELGMDGGEHGAVVGPDLLCPWRRTRTSGPGGRRR